MEIIPAINCEDLPCVRERFLLAKKIGAGWVHIDVADGKFCRRVTWNNPSELAELKKACPGLKVEAHLMVENPKEEIKMWEVAEPDRIIIHKESLKTPELLEDMFSVGELGISILPETEIRAALPYFEKVNFIQLLAVQPGFSGQKFDGRTIEKLKIVKNTFPAHTIEIDGGINDAVALEIKNDADILAVGSFLFESDDPAVTYKNLLYASKQT